MSDPGTPKKEMFEDGWGMKIDPEAHLTWDEAKEVVESIDDQQNTPAKGN
jgi:hypothetical protein